MVTVYSKFQSAKKDNHGIQLRAETRRVVTPEVYAIEFSDEGPAQYFYPESALKTCDMKVLVCVSADAAWFCGHMFGASPQELTRVDPSERCLMVGPEAVVDEEAVAVVPVSGIVLWRKILLNPAHAWQAAKWLADPVEDRPGSASTTEYHSAVFMVCASSA